MEAVGRGDDAAGGREVDVHVERRGLRRVADAEGDGGDDGAVGAGLRPGGGGVGEGSLVRAGIGVRGGVVVDGDGDEGEGGGEGEEEEEDEDDGAEHVQCGG